MNKTRQNVTRIEDLEDLEEIDDNDDDNGYDDRKVNINIEKFIRKNNNNNMPFNSGMNIPNYSEIKNNNSQHQQPYHQQPYQQQPYQQQPYQQQPYIKTPYNKPFNHYGYENQVYQNNDYYEPYESTTTPTPKQSNCVDVADHVKNCNVCSRLYNMDRTMYFIIIGILAIICILLLKKVIDV